GEASKSLAMYADVAGTILRSNPRRQTVLVAVGGGVVGDLVGFVAATLLRGVPFWQVPTSLLAMVDSAIGGKVGIDTPEGKNLLGAFHPPARVLLIPDWLRTLPKAEWVNGMAEVWKYAYIGGQPSRAQVAAASPESAEDLIWACLEHKRRVVEADEHETLGLRATLNFGHTVGHAIERIQDYRGYRHGEAVAIGMVVEVEIATQLLGAPADLPDQLRQDLRETGLPTALPPELSPDAMWQAMQSDKKADRDGILMSLLPEFGHCKLTGPVPFAAFREAVRRCQMPSA
ncbi:MAG: 3-dehydroquinate synthase, partial [Fimbriimonadaceae bacterium]|nr:3-dehydroquinate synthase [Fimbriimonadaceae bacterium]